MSPNVSLIVTLDVLLCGSQPRVFETRQGADFGALFVELRRRLEEVLKLKRMEPVKFGDKIESAKTKVRRVERFVPTSRKPREVGHPTVS